MIIDDEPIIRSGLANGIRWNDFGFEVSNSASNGKEALSIMEKSTPDVIFTDIKMPVMDGIELLINTSAKYPSVKTVLLSGYSDFIYAQKAIQYGAYFYILKPIKEEEVQDLLNKLFIELEARKVKKYYSSDLQQTSLDNRSVIENHLIKLIFDDSSDIDEYGKKLHDIRFHINEENICVMAFNCDFIKNLHKTHLHLNDILQESNRYWEKDNYPILLNNGIFYIILHSNTKLYSRDMVYKAGLFKSFIEDKLSNSGIDNVVISIGVGNIHSSLINIKTSCMEAIKALQYKFYSGKGSITQFNELNGKIKDRFESPEIKHDIDEIINSVLHGDINTIVRKLKSFSRELRKNYYDIEVLCFKFIELYMSAVLKIEESKLQINTLPPDDIYRQIAMSATLEEMSGNFEKHILDLAEQINNKNNDQTNNLIIKLKNHIRDNYNKSLTLVELSDMFSYNSSYISALFKEETGTNISDYIQSIRIENAKILLKTCDYHINEVAKEVGYLDYRHFCTVFKKETGVTPMQYRLKVF